MPIYPENRHLRRSRILFLPVVGEIVLHEPGLAVVIRSLAELPYFVTRVDSAPFARSGRIAWQSRSNSLRHTPRPPRWPPALWKGPAPDAPAQPAPTEVANYLPHKSS